ncbi:uncharacterized protein BJ171DRAFT_583849 [Polychytrium aggregatum]|uniref:uncharacterized protein n=1 Tax=Polychytrium aggregatum TaxID=110093 RepID=UPI0022FEB0C6|nr:uncharacterized protein BJ171DRAFT_583849 [Polychytrium aggregatum]KAI9202731.1 hypothetical protein BJ171DRAFT_583849 [Polychytrium aggregatum]
MKFSTSIQAYHASSQSRQSKPATAPVDITVSLPSCQDGSTDLLKSLESWFQLAVFRFEITSGVYMMEPWEKITFYGLMFLFFALATNAIYHHMPSWTPLAGPS